jgi:hypothetical protein
VFVVRVPPSARPMTVDDLRRDGPLGAARAHAR